MEVSRDDADNAAMETWEDAAMETWEEAAAGQQTLEVCVGSVKDFSGGGKNAVILNKAVTQMILEDNLPMRSTEKCGMKKCFRKMFPNYHLPSPYIVEKTAVAAKGKVMKSLKESVKQRVGDAAVTMDLVTLPKTSKGYLVSTLHFLTPKFQIEKLVIGCVRMKDVSFNYYLIALMTFMDYL